MTYNITIDDFIGDWGYSQQYIRGELAKCKNKPCNVLISSLGGDVLHALNIFQQFKEHGDVTCYLYGGVASAATIIAMGAKKVKISKCAMFLVHKVSNFIDNYGSYNSDEIQKLIDELQSTKETNDKFDSVLCTIYQDKCKKKCEEIGKVLTDGKWMTAQEALNMGFVDEIISDEDNDVKVDMEHTSKILNVVGLPQLPKVEEQKEDNSSMLKNLMNKIDSLIHKDKVDINPITMKKDYVRVNSILKIEGVEIDKDGKVTLTDEQVKSLNDKFESLEKDALDKQQLIDQQAEQIKNLGKNPADETAKVEGEDNEDESTKVSAKSMFDEIKNML